MFIMPPYKTTEDIPTRYLQYTRDTMGAPVHTGDEPPTLEYGLMSLVEVAVQLVDLRMTQYVIARHPAHDMRGTLKNIERKRLFALRAERAALQALHQLEVG